MKIKKHLATNNKTSGVNTCDYVVLHHTATGENSINGVLKTLTTGSVSCHYVVDTNGDIYKIGEDTDILWHAGQSSWQGKTDMNRYTIGIEIIGPLSDGGFSAKQRVSVKILVKNLMETHGIPLENIIRHKDISPGRKIDVMDTWWSGQYKTWEEYRKSILGNAEEPQMAMDDLEKIWLIVPEKNRKFGDYSVDARIKYLIDIGFNRK